MVEGEPLNVWDYERLAEERLEPGPFAYFAAGAGDEWTLRENVAAFSRLTLRPRVLRDVDPISTATTVLGTEIAFPVLVAPTAYQCHAHADGELATARAAAEAGTIMCLSTMATSTPAAVASAAPGAHRWFQLYVFRDEGVTSSLIEQAVDAGFEAIVLTADTPYFGRRERDLRTGWQIPADPPVPALEAALGRMKASSVAEHFQLISPSIGWRDVERFASESSLPVVVKGIQTAEDAVLAVEHGAAALVVSNHGGRQLDGVPASIEMLPEVVEAVGGRVEVLLDGGIRRGTDVVKALALGARAVLAGRAIVWGLAANGEEGVRHVLELLRAEIELALALLGCRTPEELDRTHVGPARS
jgi:isopentenyl diphosphate isomerase/L-lactate dehydrogenase-like FMN-dependent dehydrogenase